MRLSDPVGDMLTRIRNAYMRKKETVVVPKSTFKKNILDTLVRNRFIEKFEEVDRDFIVTLRYYQGQSVIRTIKRVSKPSIQHYISSSSLMSLSNKLGIYIVTTSKGVLSHKEAKDLNVGGKIIAFVE